MYTTDGDINTQNKLMKNKIFKKITPENMYYFNLEKKVAIVTGASRGIGFEIAKRFILEGSNLVICSTNINRLKKSFIKLSSFKKKLQKIYYLKIDVSSEKQVKKLVRFTLKKFKKIDILINNAGIYGPKGESFYSGRDIRKRLKLKSTLFSFKIIPNNEPIEFNSSSNPILFNSASIIKSALIYNIKSFIN